MNSVMGGTVTDVQIKLEFSSSLPAVLRGADQLHYLQHLLYLLPPCNCDTLLRLLTLLHTVQSFAQDSIGTNDEEVRHRLIVTNVFFFLRR